MSAFERAAANLLGAAASGLLRSAEVKPYEVELANISREANKSRIRDMVREKDLVSSTGEPGVAVIEPQNLQLASMTYNCDFELEQGKPIRHYKEDLRGVAGKVEIDLSKPLYVFDDPDMMARGIYKVQQEGMAEPVYISKRYIQAAVPDIEEEFKSQRAPVAPVAEVKAQPAEPEVAVAAPPVESEIVVQAPEAAPPPVPPPRPTAPAEPVAARSEPVEPVVASSEPAVAKPPVQSEIVVDDLAQSFEDPHFGGEADVAKVSEEHRGKATTAAKKTPDFLADNQRVQALIDFTKPGGPIENMNPMEALGHMCSIIMGPEKGAQFMNIISPVIEGLEKGQATKVAGNTPEPTPATPQTDPALAAQQQAMSAQPQMIIGTS